MCFELASGLRVNFHKRSIFGVGVSDDETVAIAERFRCQKGSLPFLYLGLPIGSNMKKASEWKPVIEKFRKRLANLKTRSLSFGRRLTLVKSVLNSLALYYFSIYRAPSCVINELERVRRKFFWGRNLTIGKYHGLNGITFSYLLKREV
ncbi:uncharacterized protein [Rutidosis leptorrhynchoides]|uniref:uncharacterized protein n=1 Tax=Rutidosis leptorrhynchoides TaxID=125765 RepID=UPI003A99BBA9